MTMANEMMAAFEWTIKQAVEEAELAQNAAYTSQSTRSCSPVA